MRDPRDRLARVTSVAQFRERARRRIPKVMFDYIDGAAEDEVTAHRNRTVFDSVELVPRSLVDVANVHQATSVLGENIDLPVVLGPTGMTRLFHHHGEKGAAAAAARAGTAYGLSSLGSTTIEDVAAAAAGPKWFQIYVWRDRALVRELIERCREARFQALCLTVDVAAAGKRERDIRNGMTVPPRLSAKTVLDGLLHPAWTWHWLTGEPLEPANVARAAAEAVGEGGSLLQFVDRQFDPSVTWDDAQWMMEQWGGSFVIKGILSPDDARRAVEVGADAIVVSNHGGRQLDHTPATLEVLPEIVNAVDGRAEVYLDSGVRRGTDVIKALALGARACLIGRPYLYALAADGEAGVSRLMEIFRDEIRRSLALLGCPSVQDLSRDYLRPAVPPLSTDR